MFKSAIYIVVFVFFVPLYAQSSNWNQNLYDAIYFAENGNDIIVDLEKIRLPLSNGANPNWINTRQKKEMSVLTNYVGLISLAKDTTTVNQGIETSFPVRIPRKMNMAT